MTVDLLAATFFWPEGTVLGSRPPHPETAKPPAPGVAEERADAEVRAAGFWAAMVRHLWRSPDAPAEA